MDFPSCLSFFLKICHLISEDIQVDCKKLEGGTHDGKDVEYGVHPFFLFADAVKDGTNGKADATCQQKPEAPRSQQSDDHPCKGNDGPAHANIAHPLFPHPACR